ncbi:hypothetical protein KR044_005826 [Drosophila immigrans]|nr:hypothetical protein KR044_005826 [Drosophila immigrans]
MRRFTTFRSRSSFDVMLLGDSAVGKSSLLLRLMDNKATELTQPSATVGAEYKVKTIMLPDAYIRLKICDSSGQER